MSRPFVFSHFDFSFCVNFACVRELELKCCSANYGFVFLAIKWSRINLFSYSFWVCHFNVSIERDIKFFMNSELYFLIENSSHVQEMCVMVWCRFQGTRCNYNGLYYVLFGQNISISMLLRFATLIVLFRSSLHMLANN